MYKRQYLTYDEVLPKYVQMLDWLAGLYVNVLNLIQYMHEMCIRDRYNIFQCNAILLQHLISHFDNFQLRILGYAPAKFYLSLQSAGFRATIFSAKYQLSLIHI